MYLFGAQNGILLGDILVGASFVPSTHGVPYQVNHSTKRIHLMRTTYNLEDSREKMTYEEDRSTTQVDGNYYESAYYIILVLFGASAIYIHGKWNYIAVSSNKFIKITVQ